ncbi:hypothetical protein GCM10009127_25970 [Alteraurantiacibacter aestuarii]
MTKIVSHDTTTNNLPAWSTPKVTAILPVERTHGGVPSAINDQDDTIYVS